MDYDHVEDLHDGAIECTRLPVEEYIKVIF